MHAEPVIDISDLTFTYEGADSPALKDVNLRFQRGEIAALIGPTGAGKSTLFMCLNGLIPHMIRGQMAGSVIIGGLNTATHQISHLAQQVGTVFQDPETQLFALSVEDELAFGPENLGVERQEIARRIGYASAAMSLADILQREPAALSGGQQQMVATASVLTMLPDILILDEPTSNLDPLGSELMLSAIRRLNVDYGKTIVLAEHKIDEIAGLAEHIFVMDQGRVVLDGETNDVFNQMDVLHELGLVGPTAAEVGHGLRVRGHRIDVLPMTSGEAVSSFATLLGGT